MQAQAIEKTATFKTRFGEVSYDETKILSFPNGILGMPNQNRFFVSQFPSSKMDKFQVLQSLDDSEVSFALIPLASVGKLIEEADLAEIQKVLEIKTEDMLVMLIVSIQKTPSGSRLSVNVRAPLFLDTNAKTGYQIVLANSKYPVQHFLG